MQFYIAIASFKTMAFSPSVESFHNGTNLATTSVLMWGTYKRAQLCPAFHILNNVSSSLQFGVIYKGYLGDNDTHQGTICVCLGWCIELLR